MSRLARARGGRAPQRRRAALAVPKDHEVTLSEQRLMGLHLPRVSAKISPLRPRFGVGGTSSNADEAMRLFLEALSVIAELRKTQRRCNALSKIVIPNCRQTIGHIGSTLEERERESFAILRMIRDRLARQRQLAG